MALEIDVDHWRGKLASCKEKSNLFQSEEHKKVVLQLLREIEFNLKVKDDRVSRTVAQIFELKEKDVQSDEVEIKRSRVGKKVQAGFSHLNESIEVACQSGMLLYHVEVQTEIDEIMEINRKIRTKEAELNLYELIDEKIQCDKESSIYEKEFKGKKLQVGISRLERDFEVACQTVYIILDSVGSQTEYYDHDEEMFIAFQKPYEEQSNGLTDRNFFDKETHLDDVIMKRLKVSKKVQAGFPRLDETVEVACQSGMLLYQVEVQTEIDEIMEMNRQRRTKEAELNLWDLVEEGVQYGEKNMMNVLFEKEFKGKKLQVAISRLDDGLEVSCQTGHINVDSESHTEFYDQDEDKLFAFKIVIIR